MGSKCLHNDSEWDLFVQNDVEVSVDIARSLVVGGVAERCNRAGVMSVMKSY